MLFILLQSVRYMMFFKIAQCQLYGMLVCCMLYLCCANPCKYWMCCGVLWDTCFSLRSNLKLWRVGAMNENVRL
jgi:hypothetical protein